MTCAHHADAALALSAPAARSGQRSAWWRTTALAAAIAAASWSLIETHSHGERLSRLERSDELRDAQLSRIEAKVDRLLEDR